MNISNKHLDTKTLDRWKTLIDEQQFRKAEEEKIIYRAKERRKKPA